MGQEDWSPIEFQSLRGDTSEVLLRIAEALTRREPREATLFATEGGAIAIVVPIQALLNDPRFEVVWNEERLESAEGKAVFMSQAASGDAARSLLEQLSIGESDPPRWALAGSGRSTLSAFRVAGPTATIRFQDDDGDPVKLTLFPIRLPDSDPLQETLKPGHKLPEGGTDNLDKREEWFQGRSGKDD